ncbi:MAG: hypothetical protein M3008_01160 [Chloroflexota bacterium]|nr:hypothetical protein [Chloroflexota bacterium]
MQKPTDATMNWIMRVMPVVIFAMGCGADLVLNAAVHSPQAERFLPEVCGLIVGVLTVLAFAMRRQAYFAAGIAFIFVEMVAVTLQMPLGMHVGLCAASLVTAAACLAIYARGPWMTADAVYVREQDERP